MKKFSKRTKIRALLLIVSAAYFVMMVYVLPYFIDWKQYESEIFENVKVITGRDLVMTGGIKFEAFPTPRFFVSGVRLKNLPGASTDYIFSMKEMEVRPSIMRLLLGGISVNRLIMNEPIIELENFRDTGPNWKQSGRRDYIELSRRQKEVESHLGVEKLEIHNAQLYFRSGTQYEPIERFFKVSHMEVKADGFAGPYEVSGSLMSDITSLPLNFTAEIGEFKQQQTTDIALMLTAGASAFGLEGDIIDWESKPVIDAKLDANIDRSFQAITQYAGLSDSMLPKMFVNVLSHETTDIKGDFTISADGANLSNIVFNSVDTKGKGAVTAVFDQINLFKVSLEFDSVNMDTLIEGGINVPDLIETSRQRMIIEDEKLGAASQPFSLSKDINIALELSVNNAQYGEKSSGNLYLKAEMEHNKTTIDVFKAEGLPGESTVEWSGGVEQAGSDKDAGTEFAATIRMYGRELIPLMAWVKIAPPDIKTGMLRDFDIDADIAISGKNILLKSIRLLADETNIVGQAAINTADGIVGNSAFKVNNLNLDNYLIEDNTQNSANDIYAMNAQLTKFDLLRNIDVFFKKLAISLAVNELTYRGEKFSDISGMAYFSAGSMELKSIRMNTGMGRLTANVKLDSKKLKPYVEVDLNMEKFDTAYFKKVSGSNIFDVQTEDKNKQDEELGIIKAPRVWSRERFSFEELGIFSGEIRLNIREFKHNNFRMEALSTSLKIENDEVAIRYFRGRVFDSKIDLQGKMGIVRPSINATFSITHADIRQFFRSLFNQDGITGRMSITGSLSMAGFSIYEWVSSLEGTMDISARGIRVDGFDLEALAGKIPELDAIKDVRYWGHQLLHSGKSRFDFTGGKVYLAQGVARIDNWILNQGLLQKGILSVDISLPDWTVNSTADFVLKTRGKGGYLPVAALVKGNIYNPVITWDTKGIERYWERIFFGER